MSGNQIYGSIDIGCEIKGRALCFSKMGTTRVGLYFGRILVYRMCVRLGVG